MIFLMIHKFSYKRNQWRSLTGKMFSFGHIPQVEVSRVNWNFTQQFELSRRNSSNFSKKLGWAGSTHFFSRNWVEQAQPNFLGKFGLTEPAQLDIISNGPKIALKSPPRSFPTFRLSRLNPHFWNLGLAWTVHLAWTSCPGSVQFARQVGVLACLAGAKQKMCDRFTVNSEICDREREGRREKVRERETECVCVREGERVNVESIPLFCCVLWTSSTQKNGKNSGFWGFGTVRMDSGWLRVESGGSAFRAPKS